VQLPLHEPEIVTPPLLEDVADEDAEDEAADACGR